MAPEPLTRGKHARQGGFERYQPGLTQGNRYLVDEMSEIERLQRRIGCDREGGAPQAAEVNEAGALDRVVSLRGHSKVSDVMIRS